MMTSASRMAAVAVLVLASACSDDDEGSTKGGIPLASAPSSIANSYCSALSQCYGGIMLESEFRTTDKAACVSELTAGIAASTFAQYQVAVDGGTMAYHQDKMGACLNALQAQACAGMEDGIPAECRQALAGLVPVDGACRLNEECVATAYCDRSTGCPGTCKAIKAEGTQCTDDEQCAAGLACQGHGGTPRTCRAPAQLNQACRGTTAPDCAAGLYCQGGSNTTAGTCAAATVTFNGTSGQSCTLTSLEPPAGSFCQPGLYCAMTSFLGGTCEALSTSRGACTAGAPDPCPSGEYCLIPDNALSGTCTPFAAEGQDCDGDDSCEVGLVCGGLDVCVRPLQNGSTCSQDWDCYSDNCANGVCAAPALCD